MSTEIASLLMAVSETVLANIKEIADKQGDNKKPVSIDTVSLVTGISIKDITPVIEYLQTQGRIIIHPNPHLKSGRANNPYSVSLPA